MINYNNIVYKNTDIVTYGKYIPDYYIYCDEIIIDGMMSISLKDKKRIIVDPVNKTGKVIKNFLIENNKNSTTTLSTINILKINTINFNDRGDCITSVPNFLKFLLENDYDLRCCKLRLEINYRGNLIIIFLSNKESYNNSMNKTREEVYDGTNGFIINYLGNNTEIKKLNYLYNCKLREF